MELVTEASKKKYDLKTENALPEYQVSNELRNEIRKAVFLSKVVGRKVELKHNGLKHSGLCPFHKEKSPSFTVSDEHGYYHCFGCGAHGDIIKFIMETEKLPFLDVVRRLVVEAGIVIDYFERERIEKEAKEKAEREDKAKEEYIKCFNKYMRHPSCTAYDLLLILAGENIDTEVYGMMPEDYYEHVGYELKYFYTSAFRIDDTPIEKKGLQEDGLDSLVRPKIFIKWCIDNEAPLSDDVKELAVEMLGKKSKNHTVDKCMYTTPYLKLMKEAIDEFKISDECQPKVKDVLIPWFTEKLMAIEGNKGVENKAKLLATFVRLPESAKGGVKKLNKNSS